MLDRSIDAAPHRLDRFNRVVDDRLGLSAFSNLSATQKVDALVVRDPKQATAPADEPRVELVELPIGVKQRVLHDVLAVEHRPRHPRAVSMELWAERGDRLEKRDVPRLEDPGRLGRGVLYHDL